MRDTLTQDELGIIRDFCDDHEYELHEDYSGRCMYGRECIGFVTEESAFNVAINLAIYLNDFDEEGATLLDKFNTRASEDSMGLSHIVYFPSLSVEETEEEEEVDA
jgi:hypothetical protein